MNKYHKERGVLGTKKEGKMSQIKRTGVSYGAMHPWEGHDPGKYGMFTVALYCCVMELFVFVIDKPILPGIVASLRSLPACSDSL